MYSIFPNKQGFTLLELLVAMALLVILSGALYGTYFSVMRGREAAMAGMETRRELSTTLDTLRREIDSVYFNRSKTSIDRLRFVVEDRDIFGKPASTLELTTITPPHDDTVPTSDVMVVRYAPLEKEGKLSLMRQSRDVNMDFKPFAYPQMEEIEGFLVECFNGSAWVKSWDTKINTGGLPTAIRITLRVKEGGKPMDYVTLASPRMTVL